LGEEICLYLLGDFDFLGRAPFAFELFSSGAALNFDGMSDFVEAGQREGIAVDIAESSEYTAPDRRSIAEQAGMVACSGGSSLAGILDAPKTRRYRKPNATLDPLLKFGGNVFGDECDVSGATDQLVFGLAATSEIVAVPSGGETATQRSPD
jgi:hypothetical protein